MRARHDVVAGSKRLTDPAPARLIGRGLPVLWFVIVWCMGLVSPVAAQSPPPQLSIDQLHIFVMPAGDHLVISEHYLLGNAGELAYAGESVGEPTVVFSLPVGAFDVRPGDANDPSDRYEITDSAVSDTQPILPGTAASEVRFSYSLPLSEGETIQRVVPLPATSCVVLIAGDVWRLEGPALIPFGTMDVGGETAHAYTLDPLEAGAAFAFSVVEAPAGEMPTADLPMSEVPGSMPGNVSSVGIGAGVFALGAAALAAYLLLRADRVPSLPESLRDDIAALASLDDQYAAGELPEADYLTRRETLKTHMLQRLQTSSTDD